MAEKMPIPEGPAGDEERELLWELYRLYLRDLVKQLKENPDSLTASGRNVIRQLLSDNGITIRSPEVPTKSSTELLRMFEGLPSFDDDDDDDNEVKPQSITEALAAPFENDPEDF